MSRGGAFLANIVNPILPIINAYIAEPFKAKYEVMPFTEVHIGKDGNSYLDIALMLVEKQATSASRARTSILHPLVIIELKAGLPPHRTFQTRDNIDSSKN
ncbi:hypothetical protein JCM6882_006200 [Rhodosporidiobolus microsporus]